MPRVKSRGPWPDTLRPLWVAAAWSQRPQATIRTWYRRGLISRTACDLRSRELLVDLSDVAALARNTQRRRPRDMPVEVWELTAGDR